MSTSHSSHLGIFLCRTNMGFKRSLLEVFHAELVNSNCQLGQNEWSLSCVQCCSRPFLLLSPEGYPTSWSALGSENVFTYSDLHLHGFSGQVIGHAVKCFIEQGIPLHQHVAKENVQTLKIMKHSGFQAASCDRH